MKTAMFYAGRLGQLIGMWLLLVDIFTAGPMGPTQSYLVQAWSFLLQGGA